MTENRRPPLHFLAHLAKLGAVDIHPRGVAASRALENALDLRAGQTVLEIGCGTGQTLVRMASGHAIEAYGVDILQEMLVVAHRRIHAAGLGRRVTLGEGAKRLLEELWRVVRPGGRVVANEAVWRAGTHKATIHAIYESSLTDFGLAQASAEGWTMEDWLDRVRACGFVGHAVDLRAEEALRRTAPVPRPWQRLARARALAMSAALTAFYRLRSRLQPGVRREAKRYRDLVSLHARDGRHIEPFLFVLDRPA